jgi:starch phosphorylase
MNREAHPATPRPPFPDLEAFTAEPRIAYFSMEIGLRPEIPTYSGGLGILAGDTIRSSADLKLPLVGVTLLSRKGYFRQEIDGSGRQREHPVQWAPESVLVRLDPRITIDIEGRTVNVCAWLQVEESVTGGRVPVLFLDTDLKENAPEDREIAQELYGRDEAYRLKQEAVLGIGGVRMLRALGFRVRKYHMNEGHSALLTVELLLQLRKPIESVWDERLVWDLPAVRDLCVFTTHTPVEAGHDRFAYDLIQKVLGESLPGDLLRQIGGNDHLNMTYLALNLSQFVNGVAKQHKEVSRGMFPGYEIHAITNGVHSFTWTCPAFARLYDRYLPGWANEPELFARAADTLPDEAVWAAHQEAKRELLDCVRQKTDVSLDPEVLTLGFARRMTAYKRPMLLFRDLDRLARIGNGRLQVVLAGKAHPRDQHGKEIVEDLHAVVKNLQGKVSVVFLPDYGMELAKLIVSGVDVWLNTPLRPLEASGTSGMKAAHNGVLNFSTLDGWWIEGHIEGVTGWAIGPIACMLGNHAQATEIEVTDARDAADLYDKLDQVVLPLYYDTRPGWIRMMKNAIGKIAYYFNTHRMMRRYVTEAYLR